jgi:hypothetical protein
MRVVAEVTRMPAFHTADDATHVNSRVGAREPATTADAAGEFGGEFAYLARRRFETAAGRSVTWAEGLTNLDRTGAPPFINGWGIVSA